MAEASSIRRPIGTGAHLMSLRAPVVAVRTLRTANRNLRVVKAAAGANPANPAGAGDGLRGDHLGNGPVPPPGSSASPSQSGPMFDLAAAMGGTKGAAAANGAGMLVNGHSNGHSNGRNAAAATTTPAAAAGAAATAMAQTLTAAAAAAAGEELASLVDPLGQGRMENNITPYPGPNSPGPGSSPGGTGSITGSGSPSLAVQIREIASTLRHINALRIEYMDKIQEQEMDLSAKDQALRSKEERIRALEVEGDELRRSLSLLHTAKAAAEAEVQRLQRAAADAAALPTPTAATPAAPAAAAAAAAAALATAAAPVPTPVSTAAPAPVAAPTPVAAPAPTPVPVADPVPDAAPAPVAAAPPPPPPPPPPPAPQRAPEIVLSYRSGWGEAYLQCNPDGKGWTNPPGLRMEHSGNKEFVMKLPAKTVEFVVTNGKGEWDSPTAATGGASKNYRIDAPGEYRLHYGSLSLTKAWAP